MLDRKIVSTTAAMAALLGEPSFAAAGYSDPVAAETVTEAYTFLRDPEDANSDVVFGRTVEYNAARDVLSKTIWDVTNSPTVSGIVTDQTDNKTVQKSGTSILTITGTNFGAADDDLLVVAYIPQRTRMGMLTPTAFENKLRVEATITSVNVGDTEIVATLTLQSFAKQEVGTGTVLVEVLNKKRNLRSLFNTELTLV